MHRMTHQRAADDAGSTGEAALQKVADGLADAVHTLLPDCTAAIVVVGAGPEWRLLAQRGGLDISANWRRTVARQVRDSDRSHDASDYLVAPFSAVALHVMLLLLPDSGERLAAGVRVVVQPLLDAGGILLDRAATEGRTFTARRVVEDELRSFETIPRRGTG
jgi:hypothetical protein